MMYDKVNPMAVREGDTIMQHNPNRNAPISTTIRKVKRVSSCSGDANKVHLDHQCYDSRFSMVWVQVK